MATGDGKEHAGIRTPEEYLLHDLNGLLHPIMGYSRMIMERASPGQAIYEDARQIELAARKIKVLNLSFLRAKRHGRTGDEAAGQVELSGLIFEVEGLIRGLLPDNIACEISVSERACINGSRIQLERAFLNLSINACEAMPSGGRLAISLSSVNLPAVIPALGGEIMPGEYALVSFTDNGTGICSERMKDLFESSHTTKRHGFGIGLGSVFNIVRQHNAHITVESVEDGGTTFSLYFRKDMGGSCISLIGIRSRNAIT